MGQLGLGRQGAVVKEAGSRVSSTMVCPCTCRHTLKGVECLSLAALWNHSRQHGCPPAGVQRTAAHNAVHLISQVC